MEVIDSFDRADGIVFGTADTGQAWTVQHGTWTVHDGPAESPRTALVRANRTAEIEALRCHYLLPDAHSMSFANMTAEAEAELAAWRGILHPAE